MKYRYRFFIYVVLVILAVIIAWLVSGLIFAAKTPSEASQDYITLNQCFYYQPRIPYIPHTYTMGSLIDCLSFYESSHNPNAVGKAGEIGCLQFMPSTFQHYCVEKYGLTDIWNCEEQRICADKMLKNGGINHWTTKNLCLSVLNVKEK